nr:MAG TPA_asm: hypothetical protein [Caudoviricetes sp.]
MIILSKETRTPATYWLTIPISEWGDWLNTLNELLK